MDGKEELELYNRMISCRERGNFWINKEIKIRDELLISLHQRLVYPIKKIAKILGASEYFVKKELSRLRLEGSLKR